MLRNKDNIELKLNATGTFYVEPKDVIHNESFRRMLDEISRVFDNLDSRKPRCTKTELPPVHDDPSRGDS